MQLYLTLPSLVIRFAILVFDLVLVPVIFHSRILPCLPCTPVSNLTHSQFKETLNMAILQSECSVCIDLTFLSLVILVFDLILVPGILPS